MIASHSAPDAAAAATQPTSNNTPRLHESLPAIDPLHRFTLDLADPRTPFRVTEACLRRTQLVIAVALIDCDDFRDLVTVAQARQGTRPTDTTRSIVAREAAQRIVDSFLQPDTVVVDNGV